MLRCYRLRFQQVFDAPGLFLGLIVDKFNGRHEAKIELLADFRTDKSRGALQSGQHLALVDAVAEKIEKHFGMPEILAHFRFRQIDGPDPWVTDVAAQELGENFAQQVADAIGSLKLHT